MEPDPTWVRLETDALGSRKIPRDALYGIHSLRASENFNVSGTTLASLRPLVKAFALVKKAAAIANNRLGLLTDEKADVIGRVCDELLAGQHARHLIVDVFQGGGGTSSHMNLNEIIANRGLELLGYSCGNYEHLHPVDDVNLSQSTTDVHSTALRIALLFELVELENAVSGLAESFAAKGRAFKDDLKLARTHLMDAVPMKIGEEFTAFSHVLLHDLENTLAMRAGLSQINLGGTIAGSSLSDQPAFTHAVIGELEALTSLSLMPAHDLVAAAWNMSDLVGLSAGLKRQAITLSKICNDLRLLASGPNGGIGELSLPPVQAGSPQIPGKINPVIPEMVNQVAFHIIGSDVAISLAAEAGQLQRNPFEPMLAYALLGATGMLAKAMKTLAKQCIEGLMVNLGRSRNMLEHPQTIENGLVPFIGLKDAHVLAQSISADTPLSDLLAPYLARKPKS
ncbi:aspartate ammonia-lyase [Thalassospira marina]|nr:aspartate ammonia-lyase [Thalassospira marina]